MHSRHFLTPLLFVLAISLQACTSQDSSDGGDDSEEQEADPRTLVEAEEVSTGDVYDYVVSSATVESELQVDICSETTGTVTSINVEEGDRVRKGSVLATVENPNLQATLERARADMERAQTSYEESKRLFDARAVSQRELEDAQHAMVTARATWDESRRTEAFTRLVSPFAGTVAIRDIRYGQTIQAGQRAFQVVDLDRLKVVVHLPERDLARVQVGQKAWLRPSYDPDTTIPGQVQRISSVLDPSTGTFWVTVAPQGQGGEQWQDKLRPGQFVSVRIEVARHQQVLVVPKKALVYEHGTPYLFLVKDKPPEEPSDGADSDGTDSPEEGEDSEKPFWAAWFQGKEGAEDEDEGKEREIPGPRRIAHRIPVEPGFSSASLLEVGGDLREGDLVITVGQETLRDEAEIRLPGDPLLGQDQDSSASEQPSGDESSQPTDGGDSR